MDDSFFAYLQQLELLGFFSGFPLIYAIILIIAGPREKRNSFRNHLVSFLPLSYALSGTLYLGYLLKSLYPDYSIDHINTSIHQPWLVAWGLAAILFWVPFISKKLVLALLHSLVFFILLIKDLFAVTTDKLRISNDMKVYTDSLLLQAAAYIAIVLGYYTVTWLFGKKTI